MIESKAAVLAATGEDWQIRTMRMDPPGEGEVLVRLAYAGLCYSDEHLRFDQAARLPIVGGHEGSGVVEATGLGVTGLAAGDHVALTFVAVCGRCHWCVSGRANLCESGGRANAGAMADGTFRRHGDGEEFSPQDLGAFCGLGTFSQYAVVSQNSCVLVDPEVPLPAVALVSCGVMTGWGAAVRTARTAIGDTVVVVGAGGIGLNAVQGASHAGAAAVIAVGNLTQEVIAQAFRATGRGGKLVIAGLSHDPLELNVQLPGTVLAATERSVLGSFVGSCHPARDVPLLLRLYQQGRLQLDQLVSRTYRLEEVSAGYADLAAGRNIRGVIEF